MTTSKKNQVLAAMRSAVSRGLAPMSAVRIEDQWIVDSETGKPLQLFASRAAAEHARQLCADRVHRELNRPERNPTENAPQYTSRVHASFDRHFDEAERVFPDLGTIELHEDEAAGSDNGAGSERQFGYCANEKPIVIAFAPKTEKLPKRYVDGLMAHEFGHAIDFRYGQAHLEKLWGVRLPASIERRADKIAEYTFGRPIEYGDLDIQCIGCGGKKARPRRLG